MKDQNNTPAITGKNKLKLMHRDSSQFMFSHMNMFGDDFKRIQTGLGFGFATMCNKSINVIPSAVTIKAEQEQVYLYFKYPTNGGKASLINSNVELYDTEDHYLVLLKSSSYNELKF